MVAVFDLARNKQTILMLLVILSAWLVGLYNLGDARISHDELKTLIMIQYESPSGVLTNFYSYSHVFFSLLLDIVYDLTHKFYLLRGIPVVFGVLAVTLTYRAGKSLLDRNPALMASVFLVITPLFIQYLREMRGYSAMVFFSLVILFSLWQAVTTRQKRYWLGLVIAAILGVYTHLYFTLVLGSITLIVAGEWWLARRNQRQQPAILKPYIVSFFVVGLTLAILYTPIVRQVLAVPQEQQLRAPQFGPFAPTWSFGQAFVSVFLFFSPLGLDQNIDIFFVLVLVGCVSGLWQPARRRATLWLLLWWLAPFLANLLVMAIVPGTSAQIRFHLHTLPAYLLLASSGLVAVIDYLAGLVKAIIPSKRARDIQHASVYAVAVILVLVITVPQTAQALEEKTDEAWSKVGAYLRSEVTTSDIVLCEAFRLHGGRGGDNGTCGWQLQNLESLNHPQVPIQHFNLIANFRGTEGLRDTLREQGRVWFVIYFPGPPPYSLDALENRSDLAVKQFGHTWVIRVDSSDTLIGNLIDCGHWLLNYVPDEKHQFDYHLDLAQLYALAGDMAAANLHLEQAARVQQGSTDPDWMPELARLREVATIVRFYAPVNPSPQHHVDVNFDNRLKLYGYSLEPDTLSQPAEVKVSFYWQPTAPLEKDYFVFVHLKDTSGHIVGHFDFQPFDAILPTSQWPVGTDLREARHFSVPGDLPPGEYTFVIGLYLPEDMSRLRIIEDTSGQNAARLGTLIIEGS